ncbi:DEAD/DEAH box helicase family protein [Kribbella solani]|uniref:TOTE conflict system archaeo-eukaryotic primase domain-containing protein n=1 Tax=Kribbella solani TaxID=236067 RepID=UPI0029A5D6B3|nr:DEAD/DEAH box helicase family protein [Kribbella solani]MDX3004074.1 DEAD/DEAH box helicase family protein [Kribbella solani]
MTRATARLLPLTPDVVAEHLAARSRQDLFIGLYPMLPNNTCWWLAADFDGKTAMLDALAYVKAARTAGVPAALEISQSGAGAHVWIFFTEALSAQTARAVGTALIHEAILQRGVMSLGSYDRLFPSQDVLPGSGPGNLIAAPLHGNRRKNGLTLFLDPATLEPYEDQWAFLSTLDRLTPGDAGRIARKASRATVGSDVTTLARAESTKVHPPMPPVVRAELAAGLVLDAIALPPAALATFKHAASMANPKFYELQRLRKSTWDTPRFVTGYDLTLDEKLVLPRGLRHLVTGIVERSGARLDVTDNRTAGKEIDVALIGELTDRQAGAVGELLGHDDGILVAPPGSGKTVMACAIIAERAVSTLILVDRKALADQWRTRLTEFLGLKPGQLGGGRTKLTGIVDVAMLPALARHDDIEKLTTGYGQIIVDEAHHVAAAAYDHSVKKIGARYWLGLTATPDRRDGLGELLRWQLGPVRHTMTDEMPGTLPEADDASAGPARVLHVHETSFTAADIAQDAPSLIAEAHRALTVDKNRNEKIVDDVHAALTRGRNCLILTRRVAHLESLTSLLAGRGHEPLVLQGGMPVKERCAIVERLADAKAGDGVLVVGTTPFVGEGFDAPALDTLFLAAPVSFDGLLLQCAGRVVRPAPGKTVAEVHDYHDVLVPLLAVSLQRRMPGYKRLRFERA